MAGVNSPVHYEMLVEGIHWNPQEGEDCLWGGGVGESQVSIKPSFLQSSLNHRK